LNVSINGAQVITDANTTTPLPPEGGSTLAAGLVIVQDVSGTADAQGHLDVRFWSAGGNDQNFVINGIDVSSGALPAVQTLSVADSGPRPENPAPLTFQALQSVFTAAVDRWATTGLTAAQVTALHQVQYIITDLEGDLVSVVNPAAQIIWVDATAAGYGWYVDSTPANDWEFHVHVGGTEYQATSGLAATRVDLLTNVMHELGHLLGLTDLPTVAGPNPLMAETLPTGTRRLPDGLIAAWPQTGSVSHGLTQDGTTIAGTASMPGALVTVSLSAGSVAGADASPQVVGYQVQADASGRFHLEIVPPVAGGTVRVWTNEVAGPGGDSLTTGAFAPKSTWQFDFNSHSAATADGFIGVGPVNAYDAAAAFGWNVTAGTFDQGVWGDLLRDGHWGRNNTFLVDVPDGNYVVNVTMGGAWQPSSNTVIWAKDGDTWTPKLENLATAPGQYIHRSFEVQVLDGRLQIQFVNCSTDLRFMLNALEVFPADSAGNLSLSGWTPLQAADGTTVDSITVDGATAGALYTVAADLGAVVGSDASAAYAGFQVLAPAESFTLDVRRPTGIGSGTPTIRVQEVTGRKSGALDQVYALPAARRFDFDGWWGETQQNFIGVRGTQLYDDPNGYGWTEAVQEFDRGTYGYGVSSVALYRDGHSGSTTQTFQVAVEPDQEYSVRVYVGDRFYPLSQIQVLVEGTAPVVVPATEPNQFQALTIAGAKSADDGVLDITIGKTGGDPYWVINGIDIWRSDNPLNDPSAQNLLAAEWGGQMVGQRLSESMLESAVLAARDYWVTTGLSDAQIVELYRTPVAIGDLSYRGALGVHKPEGIWLDASGAGLGWSVGSGQWSVVSGQWFGGESEQLTTANGQLPAKPYDLLTVVTHELGHVLGYGDLDSLHHPDHIMAGVLQPGERRGVSVPLGMLDGPAASLLALDELALPRWTEQSDERAASLTGQRELAVARVLDDLLRDGRDDWHHDEDDEDDQFARLRSGTDQKSRQEIDHYFTALEVGRR
jgi:hypothetical protein